MKEQLFFGIIGIAIILITILLIIPFLASLGEYAREPMSNGILEGLTSLLLCILFSVAAFILLCMQSKQRYNSYWPGLLSFVISMFLLLGFFSGKSYYYQNSKKIHTAINRKKDWFEWKICMSHPRFNPVEISSGSFTYSMNTMKKYRSFYDVQGSFNESWGLQRYLSPGQNIRDEYTAYPMPESVSIYWFSLIEAKFYKGEFELPHEKLKELFSGKGYLIDGKYRKFNALNLGFSPGGGVTLWAVYDKFNNVEIARFQGEVYEGKPGFVVRYSNKELTKEEYASIVLSDPHYQYINDYHATHTHESEIALFERYTHRFNTRFKFNAADEAADQLTEFELKFANGESFNYSFEDNPMQENGYYATLRSVKLTWNHTDSDGKIAKRIGSVDAGQKAFLHLYDEAWRDTPDKEMDVIINLSADNRKLEFYLTDGINRYDIDSELIEVDVYDCTLRDYLLNPNNDSENLTVTEYSIQF